VAEENIVPATLETHAAVNLLNTVWMLGMYFEDVEWYDFGDGQRRCRLISGPDLLKKYPDDDGFGRSWAMGL
jgi:hypothetical protein